MYRPGDIFYAQFTTVNISGISTNTDTLPSGHLFKNGRDDFTPVLCFNNVDVGRYVTSGTIPSTYAIGTSIGVVVSGYVAGSLSKTIIDLGQVDTVYVGNGVAVTGSAPANFLGLNSTFPGLTVSATGNPTVTLNLGQNITTTNNIESLGDCLMGARVQAYGNYTLTQISTTGLLLSVYSANGTLMKTWQMPADFSTQFVPTRRY